MEKKELEKKMDALLDDEDTGEEAEKENQEEQKIISDPAEQLRVLCQGTLKLMTPIRAHSEDVKEIKFDFCGLKGIEVMDALDSVMAVNNMFGISNKQAMALFAATAEKCAPMVEDGGKTTRLYDAKDIKSRLAGADAIKAMQLAKLFYNASSQAGNSNISNK
ncbi:MAG: hypothetical protein IKN04_08905 [Clostridia bacterium]|nr:hypothetical protein [Clostridia bacterium]